MVARKRRLASDELTMRRDRRGMSLIEVIFAIVILSGVLLAMTRFGDRFVKSSGQARWVAIASDLAGARLEFIRAWDDRTALATEFQGLEVSAQGTPRPTMSHAPGFSRLTTVTTVSGTNRVRVTVVAFGMGVEVAKSMELFTR